MLLNRGRVIKWGAVLLLLALLLATAGCGSSKVVAEVNGEKITRAEYDTYVNVLRFFMPELESMLEDKSISSALEAQILDTMVDTVIIKQDARSQNIEVTDEEAKDYFAQAKEQLLTALGSEEEFGMRLKELKIEEQDLIAFIAGSLYSDKIIEAFAQKVTDGDIAAFMEQYPEYVRVPAMLDLSHILLETEEDALAARERALAGEDFNLLAEELSKDPGVLTNRGDYGDIPVDSQSYYPEFMAGGNALTEIGEISLPVESVAGWHIIKLRNRTEETVMSVEQVRRAAAEERFYHHFEDLYAASSIKINL